MPLLHAEDTLTLVGVIAILVVCAGLLAVFYRRARRPQ
jgi:hypothetical protein